LDPRRQRALFRYYLAAGAGGLAVGVHTTQFAIRDPKVALLRPVLELAAEELGRAASGARAASPAASGGRFAAGAGASPLSQPGPADEALRAPALIGIAGICGATSQALAEATLARELRFDAGLLSLGALAHASETELLEHCRAVAAIIPLVGFYLQP